MHASTDAGDSPHHWQNFVVAATAEAATGLLPPEVQSLYVEADQSHIVLHFAVLEANERLETAVEAILDEMDVSIPFGCEIRVQVYEGADDWAWEGRRHRAVYSSYRSWGDL